jgi:hypothetical protein
MYVSVAVNHELWVTNSEPFHLVLCLSADMQHLAIYHNKDFYEDTLLKVTLNVTVAWGWFMFALNTILTGSIIARILCVTFLRNLQRFLRYIF